jgi:hypothetical protein
MVFAQYRTHWFRIAFSTWCQEQDVPRDPREMALGYAEWQQSCGRLCSLEAVELRRGLWNDGLDTVMMLSLNEGVYHGR